jgi:hypothetical protein
MLSKLSLITALGLATGTLPLLAGTSAKAPAPVAPPQETPLGVTLGIGYDTDYVYRGLETAKNLVTASIDFNHPINDVISLDLNAWFGVSADDRAVAWAGGGSYEELRLSGTILANLGAFTAGVKYTYFDYLGHSGNFVEDVNEVGLVLGTSVAGFELGFYGAYDDATDGYYFEYAVSRKIQINDTISIVPGVLISHATGYYDVSGGNNVLPNLSVPIKLTKSATLTPYIAGNLPIDSLKDTGERNRVFGGVRLTVSF